MSRLVSTIEAIAGLFLGLIALMTCLEAGLRYAFSVQIPDAYLLAGALQAIALFWGIATTTYSGRHIAVDMLWESVGPSARRAMGLASNLITFGFFALFAYMLIWKVVAVIADAEVTTDLEAPIWPSVLLASLGIGCAAALALLKTYRDWIEA